MLLNTGAMLFLSGSPYKNIHPVKAAVGLSLSVSVLLSMFWSYMLLYAEVYHSKQDFKNTNRMHKVCTCVSLPHDSPTLTTIDSLIILNTALPASSAPTYRIC